MVNYNLLQHCNGSKSPQNQTFFKPETSPKTACMLPYKLSMLPTRVFSPKIKEKQFEKCDDFYLAGTLAPHEKCGEFTTALGCEDFGKNDQKHDRLILTYNCGRLGCSVDMEKVAYDVANTATGRLMAGLKLYREAGHPYTLRHFAFSPDQDRAKRMIEQGNYNHLKRELNAILKESGIVGSVIIFHMWRQVGEKENVPDNVTLPDGFKEGDWYKSPHFHVMGAGFILQADKFYNKYGWVYVNLGKRHNHTQIRRTIQYTLTHCALHKNHHALTYTGIFSYTKLRTDIIEELFIPVPCSACGKSLHKYALDYSWNQLDTLEPDWEQDLGVYYRKVKIRHYKLSTHSGSSLNEFLEVLADGLNWIEL